MAKKIFKIVDSDNFGLPDVRVENTTLNILEVSDFDGLVSIEVRDNDVLKISFAGSDMLVNSFDINDVFVFDNLLPEIDITPEKKPKYAYLLVLLALLFFGFSNTDKKNKNGIISSIHTDFRRSRGWLSR